MGEQAIPPVAAIVDSLENVVRRLREIAEFDSPAELIRYEADILERRIKQMRLALVLNDKKAGEV